jgi:hypothetical protein
MKSSQRIALVRPYFSFSGFENRRALVGARDGFMLSSHARKLPALRAFTGLAGSPFSNLHVVPPQAPQPSPAKCIKVHFCFDQGAGETKPDRCKCTVHFTKEEAYEAVDAGRASFLLVKNPKTPKLTKNHRAIVVHQQTVDGQSLFALAAPVKPNHRDTRHEAIKDQVRQDARRILQKLLAVGAISPQDAQMTDADLEAIFQKPESFLERICARKRLRDAFAEVVTHWWNNLLGYHKLNLEAGQFMTHADRGAGELVTGGYDSTKLGEVEGARETNTGRVKTANFRKAYWNGGWTSSADTGPEGETFCEAGEHEPVDFGPTASDDDDPVRQDD